jgi:hypothetical protein
MVGLFEIDRYKRYLLALSCRAKPGGNLQSARRCLVAHKREVLSRLMRRKLAHTDLTKTSIESRIEIVFFLIIARTAQCLQIAEIVTTARC